MATENKRAQRQHIWNSRRYLTLIHAAVLSAAASSMALAAPKSAKIVVIEKASGKPVTSAWLWRAESAAAGTGVIAGDALLLIEEQRVLKSLDLRTGKPRWQTRLALPTAFTPIVGEGKVIVYTKDRLSAYALANGRRLWQADLPAEDVSWALSEEVRPVLAAGRVFVCSGGTLMALLAHDGQPAWSYGDARIREKQTPLVEGNSLFVRTTDPEEPWQCYSATEGLVNGESVQYDVAPRGVQPVAAVKGKERKAISPDRRTLTVSTGRRSWKYQAPSPFTIRGIVGETKTALCIQIVETTASSAKASTQQAIAR